MKKEEPVLARKEALNLAVVMPRFFIKSKTNDGEFAKQYFLAVSSDTTEPALIIRKLVFTDNLPLYSDFELLKQYKGKYLLQQRFGIKLSTLSKVIAVLNEAQR